MTGHGAATEAADYVERRLSYQDARGETQSVVDAEIARFGQPVVVLGEPGMGKTRLLQRRGAEPGWAFRSARAFVARPEPARLVPEGAGIVIDGLDELSAAQNSDPVFRVLGQLIRAGCPKFILSCRSADWQGAVARQDIERDYGHAPIGMTIEPLDKVAALRFLTGTLPARWSIILMIKALAI